MGACWACGKLGHFADRCPRAQGNPNIQHDRGQSLRGGARGPADPWRSPNFDNQWCPQNPKWEGQFPVVIVAADEEPMLQVLIEDEPTPMLVDTGATYTCVSQQYATHLPMSNKFVETIGFSKIKQLVQMTAPVHLSK